MIVKSAVKFVSKTASKPILLSAVFNSCVRDVQGSIQKHSAIAALGEGAV